MKPYRHSCWIALLVSSACCLLLQPVHAEVVAAKLQQSPASFAQFGGAYTQEDSHEMWLPLRAKYFADRPIIEGIGSRVTLTTPERAENDAAVPVSIQLQTDPSTTVQPVSQGNSAPASGVGMADKDPFKKVYLIVDVNPAPVGGIFTLADKRAMTEITTHVRVNGYTYIRVVAETAAGKLYMDKRWVKSTGAGCSAPPNIDQEEHKKRLGKMRFTLPDNTAVLEPRVLRLMISHPNNTGMQRDQLSTLFIPEHYVKQIKVSFNQQPLLEAETSFTLSENPGFGFNFAPDESGILRADMTDSENKTFSTETSIHGVER